MSNYWYVPDLPEEKELMDKYKVEMEEDPQDHHTMHIIINNKLVITVSAYPEEPGVSTDLTLKEKDGF